MHISSRKATLTGAQKVGFVCMNISSVYDRFMFAIFSLANSYNMHNAEEISSVYKFLEGCMHGGCNCL